MKPRVGVYLSEQTAGRLTAAAQHRGATKSGVVEAALDRFLGSEDENGETAVVAQHLTGLSRQLEQLERDLRIVNETVALHARFHLAATPAMPEAVLRGACRLGAERFEEFAAQVGRRTDLRIPLMLETIERVGSNRPILSGCDPAENRPPFATSADNEADLRASSAVDEVSKHTLPSGSTAGMPALRDAPPGFLTEAARARSSREEQVGAGRTALATPAGPRRERGVHSGNAALIMRVFLPFAAGCYLAFLFRTINALIAAPLALEFGLGAGDLGLLTSVYFLTFAAAQIPVGIVLDRDGPRRIQSALLLAIAVGAALFASSENFWGLI